MEGIRRYPFSTEKHAHDIELYKNHLLNVMFDMDSGDIPMDETRYRRIQTMYYGDLRRLLNAMGGACGRPVMLTGKEIGLAKQIVAWAAEYRSSRNRK